MKLGTILKLVNLKTACSASVSTEKGIEINKGQKEGLFLVGGNKASLEDAQSLLESLAQCEADNKGSATNLCKWKERLESGFQVRGSFSLLFMGVAKVYYAAEQTLSESGSKSLQVNIRMIPKGGSEEIPDVLRMCPYCGDPMDPHMGEESGKTWSWEHPESEGCPWSGYEGITNRQISAVKSRARR